MAPQGGQDRSVEGSGWFSSLGGDEWDPELLLAAMDDEILDLRSVKLRNQKKKRKLNSDPNKARNERRQDLINLRVQVEELESKRDLLQSVRGQKVSGDSSSKPNKGEIGGDSMSIVWREVCARQLKQRLRVERENVQLKKNCEKEMEVVESLKKLLYKQPVGRKSFCLEPRTSTRRIEIPTGYVSDVAALIFDELSAGVSSSFNKAEFVVETNSPVPVSVMTQSPLVRATGGRKMEVFDHHIVPFGLKETCEAWWQHWHNYRGRYVKDTTSDVVTESFGLEFKDLKADKTATFYVQQILRRQVEDERTVIVWNAYIEPFTFENKRVSGVYFFEQSHVLIKPDGGCTRMSTCETISPHFLDPTLSDDPKMAALSNFVAKSFSSNITTRNEKVDDMLVGQTLQRQ